MMSKEFLNHHQIIFIALLGIAIFSGLTLINANPTGAASIPIQIIYSPVAVLTASPVSGSAPLTVHFDASQSYPRVTCTKIDDFTWNFGDGHYVSSNYIISTNYTYENPGVYNATLAVSNNCGTGSDYIIVNVNATPNAAPTANFTWSPVSPVENELVSFTDTSSDSDGYIASWYWYFGDGSYSTLQNPTHTYSTAGNYTVTLNVTDDDGAQSTIYRVINISKNVTCTDSDNGLNYYLRGVTYSSINGTNYTDYCNGTVLNEFYCGSENEVLTDFHTCSYTCSNGTCVNATPNQAPTADFTWSPSSPVEGEQVSFTDESYDKDGSVVAWYWQFGDGNSSKAQNPVHTYATSGDYSVKLNVSDNDGTDSGFTIKTITVSKNETNVTPNAAPTAHIDLIAPNPAYYNANQDDSINFTGHGTDSDGTIVAYEWYDGSTLISTSSTFTRSASNFTYGSHTISFKVQDNDGAWSSSVTATLTISNGTIANQAPVAVAHASPTSGSAPLIVNFSALDSYDPDGYITSYTWNFGDGTSSSTAALSHKYLQDGHYNAVLTVKDDDGETSSDSILITVLSQDAKVTTSNLAPTAIVSASTTSGAAAPLTISFSGLPSYDRDGKIVSYLWDFGDGTKSYKPTPIHTYSVPGTYTAKLIVTDDKGAKTVSSVNIYVGVKPMGCTLKDFKMPDMKSVDVSATMNSAGYSGKWKLTIYGTPVAIKKIGARPSSRVKSVEIVPGWLHNIEEHRKFCRRDNSWYWVAYPSAFACGGGGGSGSNNTSTSFVRPCYLLY